MRATLGLFCELHVLPRGNIEISGARAGDICPISITHSIWPTCFGSRVECRIRWFWRPRYCTIPSKIRRPRCKSCRGVRRADRAYRHGGYGRALTALASTQEIAGIPSATCLASGATSQARRQNLQLAQHDFFAAERLVHRASARLLRLVQGSGRPAARRESGAGGKIRSGA